METSCLLTVNTVLDIVLVNLFIALLVTLRASVELVAPASAV